jgi:phage tail-like protein
MTSVVPRSVPSNPDRIRRAPRSPNWLVDQLPVGMLDSDFFVRFVGIFQNIGGSLLEDADNVDNIVDTTVAPDGMVRWLASWIGAQTIDESVPDELQRRIVRGAARSLTWRGTAVGLRQFLELTSGGAAEISDGGGIWRDGQAPADTAWVKMTVESVGWLEEDDFVALVRDEIPAHVRAELFVGQRRIWSSDDDI